MLKFKKKDTKDYEEEIDLLCYVDYEIQQRNVGAYLVRDRNKTAVVFGFTFEAANPLAGLGEISESITQWRDGIKGFPPASLMRIHQRSYKDLEDRREEQLIKAQQASNPSVKHLNYLQLKHEEKLTDKTHRLLYDNHCFVYYTIDNENHASDRLEIIKKSLQKPFVDFYKTLNQEKTEQTYEDLKNFLDHAYNSGFCIWEEKIKTGMGLPVFPMVHDEMRDYAFKEFNAQRSSDPAPYTIKVKEKNGQLFLEQVLNTRLSPKSELIQGVDGYPAVPEKNYQWFRLKNRYVAAIVLEKLLDGFDGDEHQYKFFWEVFHEIKDCEVVAEVSLANTALDEFKLQRNIDFTSMMAKKVENKGGHSVYAEEEKADSIDAQREIIRGAKIIDLSVVIFISRSTKRDLDIACQRAINLFPAGKVVRECDNPLALWRNKQPFNLRDLVNPFRRNKYLSSRMPLPVVGINDMDREGVEFLSRDGGMPIYFNPQKSYNAIFVAGARGGKTTTKAAFIIEQLSRGINERMLDYGNVDSSNSYTELADYLGDDGANINVVDTQYNLVEQPNFSGFNEERRINSNALHRNSTLTALKSILFSGKGDLELQDRSEKFLESCLNAFYDDPVIQKRFEECHRAGQGTTRWLDIPLLEDLTRLAKDYDLSKDGGEEFAREAKNKTIFELSSFMNTPIGRNFSAPSTIDRRAKFINFSLRGAGSDQHIALCATVAQMIVLNDALEKTRTNVTVDEGNILLEKEGLAANIKEMVVNGGKSGISVSFLVQDLQRIYESPYGQDIMSSMNLKYIGRIEKSAVKTIAHLLEQDPAVFAPNATRQFEPNAIAMCSYWLIVSKDQRIRATYHPPIELMALMGSWPWEREARKYYLKGPGSTGNKHKDLVSYAQLYEKARRSGNPIVIPQESYEQVA